MGLSRILSYLTLCCCCVLACAVQAEPEGYLDENIQQAEEDASLQAKPGNWVLAPIPVSNPTVGTGLQAVLLYLHPKQPGEADVANATSGLVGMYTDSKSWVAGAFHDGNWGGDLYRYRLFAGQGNFNLNFYGIGQNPKFIDDSVKYSLQGQVLGGQLQRRLPGTREWYGGISYVYMDTKVSFKLSNLQPDLPDVSKPFINGGLGLLATYDSRDDNYYPQRGQMFQLSLTDYGETWGGDYEYDMLKAFYNHYLPLRPETTLAMRAFLQSSNGNAPFFALPNLNMRGFSRDRYRDDHSLSLHAELRHKFRPRWGAVAFLEAGWVGGELNGLLDGDVVTSEGVGLRWQATEDKALNLGLDLAFSDGDSTVYIRVGEMF